MGSSSITRQMSSSSELVNTEIGVNDVVIFSKSYCPYCTKTKDRFADMGVSAKVFELDNMSDGGDIQSELLTMTGQRTVPNVFIKGNTWVVMMMSKMLTAVVNWPRALKSKDQGLSTNKTTYFRYLEIIISYHIHCSK